MGLRLRVGRRGGRSKSGKKRAKRGKKGKKPWRFGQVIRIVHYQTGSSVTARDRMYEALPPGKRRSRSGRIYWETRRNRSDRVGQKV